MTSADVKISVLVVNSPLYPLRAFNFIHELKALRDLQADLMEPSWSTIRNDTNGACKFHKVLPPGCRKEETWKTYPTSIVMIDWVEFVVPSTRYQLCEVLLLWTLDRLFMAPPEAQGKGWHVIWNSDTVGAISKSIKDRRYCAGILCKNAGKSTQVWQAVLSWRHTLDKICG